MSAPTVTSLSPATGPSSGGTAVLIVGTGFTGATHVRFGSVDATSYVVASATLIAATAPLQAAGAVNVTVTNTTDETSADVATFTYAGSALFTVAEARAFDKGQLAVAATFTSAAIAAKELAIRSRFQRIIGVALVETDHDEYHDGDGSDTLLLSRHNPFYEAPPRPVTVTAVYTVDSDGTETAFTADQLADLACYPYKLTRKSSVFPAGSRNIRVQYRTGYVTPSDEIKQAALAVLVMAPPDGLVPSSIAFNAYEGSDGTIKWSAVKDPDRGRWYGSEAVDAVLREHRGQEMGGGVA